MNYLIVRIDRERQMVKCSRELETTSAEPGFLFPVGKGLLDNVEIIKIKFVGNCTFPTEGQRDTRGKGVNVSTDFSFVGELRA